MKNPIGNYTSTKIFVPLYEVVDGYRLILEGNVVTPGMTGVGIVNFSVKGVGDNDCTVGINGITARDGVSEYTTIPGKNPPNFELLAGALREVILRSVFGAK